MHPENIRVLVVDDEAMTRAVLVAIVKKAGFDVVTASNGREAWEILCQDNPPSVALVDWMMPEMTGVELCRKVRERKDLPYVYFILLTGRSETSDLVEGLGAGADDFLAKPANPDELRSRLAVGVRTIGYERELEEKNRQRAIFKEAFNSCIQEMLISDPERKILYANPATVKTYGYDLPELVGQDVYTLNETREGYAELGVSGAEYDLLYGNMARQVSDPAQGVWRGQVFARTKAGRTIWADLIVSAIRDSDSAAVAFVSIPVDITDRVQQEFRIRLECYNALSALAEARDNETGLHLKRMGDYARCLAQELGMPGKYVEDIASFAPLHDIGKVGIPDHILLAPRKLTDDEFEIMKTHSAIGYDILKNRTTLEMAAEIAFTHHEKVNGAGYPRGLAGEDIPLCGRIVAVIDVYDALRSERPYKKPWTHAKAVEVIVQDSGRHFDPKVVAAFERVQHLLEAINDHNADVWPSPVAAGQ